MIDRYIVTSSIIMSNGGMIITILQTEDEVKEYVEMNIRIKARVREHYTIIDRQENTILTDDEPWLSEDRLRWLPFEAFK